MQLSLLCQVKAYLKKQTSICVFTLGAQQIKYRYEFTYHTPNKDYGYN